MLMVTGDALKRLRDNTISPFEQDQLYQFLVMEGFQDEYMLEFGALGANTVELVINLQELVNFAYDGYIMDLFDSQECAHA